MSILATTRVQFHQVAGRLDPEPQITQQLRHPRRSRIVSVPIRTDADHPLRDRGIFIITEVLANAGGNHRLLLRVGAGPPVLLVERGRGKFAVA